MTPTQPAQQPALDVVEAITETRLYDGHACKGEVRTREDGPDYVVMTRPDGAWTLCTLAFWHSLPLTQEPAP